MTEITKSGLSGMRAPMESITQSVGVPSTWNAPSGLRVAEYGRCTVFFFQAEDGIRDVAVTGVQTCALPIFDLGLDGKRALVTGAGVGIGRGIARWLAKAGCDVALADKDEVMLAEAVAEIGDRKSVV